ncbi:selenide, water dikinase SelD [Rhodobacteraceae bacterium XHP0102]|nr:selenide, water dikinase SelD [Rhodobacteraceae bacterium XHP0102]
MQMPWPITREIVLVGGGHSHALVARMWGMRPLAGARLTMISPHPSAAYSGMLPGALAGHYAPQDVEIDLVRLARFADARLILDPATEIDRAAKQVILKGGRRIAYDTLSIDIGITTDMPALSGFSEHALPIKPLERFATVWEAFVGNAPKAARIAIIGGGVAGVEVAMAVAHRLRGTGCKVDITIFERARALQELPQRAQTNLRFELTKAGIALREQTQILAITEKMIHLADGTQHPADLILGAAGARAHDWLTQTGLALKDGFIRVGPTLQSVSDPHIFATGDCAYFDHAPRSKAGVYAVRSAMPLFENLRAMTTGGALRPYHPQKTYLKLISLGDQRAIATRGSFVAKLPGLWRWKDHIDRSFMAQLTDFPAMTARANVPQDHALDMVETLGPKPQCGGCGAKLGQAALEAALPPAPTHRSDIEMGRGDDAALLRIDKARQVISTDHLRPFCNDPALMAKITAIHALGDIWAMGARAQSSLAMITLPPLSQTLQTQWLSEIMSAAAQVMSEAGADIIGGHSSTGMELSIGFTVTGLLDGPPIGLAGARAGDALILTKPIGAGVLLAAEMQGQAKGRDIARLYQALISPQGTASNMLAPHARAMTDVTGFGLAGHVMNIARASGKGAQIWLDHVPLYQGALDLAAAGVQSTLYPQNRAHPLGQIQGTASGPRADLLFDPQTAGGLLAALPQEAAPQVIAALQNMGQPAWIIGQITDQKGVLEIRAGD